MVIRGRCLQEPVEKYYVNGVPVEIIAERVQYYDKEGTGYNVLKRFY
jgi:hypothetical protein